MIPMTPSGTRTRWMCRPFGLSHSAATVPTGSGSSTISSMLRAMASTRFSSRRNRSSIGPPRLASSAAAMSRALASRISDLRARMAAAARVRAAFLVSVALVANAEAAATAAFPRRVIKSEISSLLIVPPRNYQVIAVNDLIAPAKPEYRCNLRGLASQDTRRINIRITEDAASNLRSVGPEHTHGIAPLKPATRRRNPGRKQASTLVQRLEGAGVYCEGAGGFQRAGNPLLAGGYRVAVWHEPGAASTLLLPAHRMFGMTGGNAHITTGSDRNLRRHDLGRHSTGANSRCGCTRH